MAAAPRSSPLEVYPIAGGADVSVTHSVGVSEVVGVCRDVFVAINPFESGIEVVRLGLIDLPDEGCLIDGETIDTNDRGRDAGRPLGRPVGLVSIDFLRDIWQREGRIGSACDDDASRIETRLLPEQMEYGKDLFIFDVDIVARQRKLSSGQAGDNSLASLWLREWGRKFLDAMNGRAIHEDLRGLCPVTWKVLELAFAWGALSFK